MIAQHLAALTFRDDERGLSRIQVAALLLIHLAGLAIFWRLLQQPIWYAVLTLVLLLAAMSVVALRTRRPLAIETLAPLFFLYATVLARVITIWFIRAPLPYQDESTLANLRLLVFQIELAFIAALVYTALIQIARLTQHAARSAVILAIGLSIVSLAWFATETISHRTRGVTGTDPYAYAQMAVDLATRGTPLHEFSLFGAIKDLGVKWYPIEHIGYRLFENETGSAATVWPPGGSLWLAMVYRVIGEDGLCLATPLAALASLMAFALLAWEYFREHNTLERAVIVLIAVALLATSWEQVDRSLVPLVDVQAQLFSTLAIWAALRAGRAKRFLAFGAFTGFALGAAYLVRHTQVLLVIPVLVVAWRLPMRERIRFLVTAGIASLAIALPDLIYHQQNFGSWLTPESNELALFSIPGIAKSTQVVADRFFAGNEFGYLFPFLLYGTYRALRENVGKWVVLASWFVVLVGFHLFYEALRMRDLLPEFPVVVLLTAYGIVALVRDLRGSPNLRGWRFSIEGVCALVIFLALILSLTRTQFTLMRVMQPAKVTFGYMTVAQRESFDRIAALMPPNAVIGSTMNDGAIDLYTHRATFRPADWSLDERVKFIDAMFRAGRRVFLLDDGAETSATRRDLSARYVLNQVGVFDVPLFSVVDGTAGGLYEIIK